MAVAILTGRTAVWVALLAATAAWTVVGLGTYVLARRLGRGGDEPAP